MIVLEADGRQATFEDGEWTQGDSDLLLFCRELHNLQLETLTGYTPWPDLGAARALAEMLGGRIIQADQPDYINDPPGLIY